MNSHDKCVLMGLGKYCKIVMSVLKKNTTIRYLPTHVNSCIYVCSYIHTLSTSSVCLKFDLMFVLLCLMWGLKWSKRFEIFKFRK